MSYLNFDKEKLVNLEYSLNREYLRTNGSGTYSSSTIADCNTRKYHGLMIAHLEELDGGRHVLLSSLDETIIQHDAQFNLGIHKYPGESYDPKGHKYIRNFGFDTIAKLTYRVGGVIFSKARLIVENENLVIVKYTLEEANSPTVLRFKPFLAFRNVHTLSKANLYANTRFESVKNGIKMGLYEGYPELSLQFSKPVDFVPVPDWYRDIEYIHEQARGYDYREDLFVPGYFEVAIKKGESIYFAASTVEQKPTELPKKYEEEKKRRIPRDSFANCLINAIQQFVWERKDGKDLLAGFPWYETIPRHTMLSLSGLLTSKSMLAPCEEILKTNLARIVNGLMPKYVGVESGYDAVDAPLLAFVAIQDFCRYKTKNEIWENYGSELKSILSNFKIGTLYNIKMQANGLLYAKHENIALTWMDSYLDGKPVTQRGGLAVEVNALWYNAICFAIDLAKTAGDKLFIKEWQPIADQIFTAFIETFWCDEKGYLADCVDGNEKNWSVRPNMIIAAALEFSPLSREQKKLILSKAKNELLTSRGLRSLAPEDPDYKGICCETERGHAEAAHQGSVFPFLILPFIKLYLDIHKVGGLSFVKKIIANFEEEMNENCIGTLSELYEGNPPHAARGAVSQAWNVGAVLKAYSIIETFEYDDKNIHNV